MKLKIITIMLTLSLVKISASASAEVMDCVSSQSTFVAEYSWQHELEIAKMIVVKQPLVEEVEVEGHSGMKTWMPHNLFNKDSLQYEVQQMAVTDKYGFRGIAGRYCVAVGSGVTTKVGELIDVVLANGEVIPCVVSDCKNNKHTDSTNIFTVASGCCCEFIIDDDCLVDRVRQSGDVSSFVPEWDSPIVEFRIYEGVNVLD